MASKKAPDYLCELMPLLVRDKTDYNLRNSNHISIPKTHHVKTYNSFIPKTIRDWNNLGAIKNCKSIDGFKTMYKREFFRRSNPIHNIDHNGGNIHITRLRLGLSHLKAHLYTHNLIDDPTCDNCKLEPESTAHYLLRCPVFAVQRAKFLSDLLTILENDYLADLRDNDIVELFLFGNDEFPHQSNLKLNEISQAYIIDSKRFQDRAYH